MPAWAWVVIVVVAVVVVAIVVWRALAAKRTRSLQGRFGPEHDDRLCRVCPILLLQRGLNLPQMVAVHMPSVHRSVGGYPSGPAGGAPVEDHLPG